VKKRFASIALLLVIPAALAAAGDPKPADSSIVQKQFDAWNAHDPDKVTSFYTDDVVYEDVTEGAIVHGREEMRKFVADFLVAVPDLKLEVVSSSLENSKGSVEWVFSGTDVGLYKTGKKFSVRGASLFEMRGGKFSKNKDFYDSATIMRQVGALPETGSTSSSPK
jgi:steroid delta-isomerase-like uncharacterized protein